MKSPILFLVSVLFIAKSLYAQESGMIYLDAAGNECNERHAHYFRTWSKEYSLYKFEDRNLSNKVVQSGCLTSIAKNFVENRQALFKYYDTSGTKTSEGVFINGMRDGMWRYYYPGTGRLKIFANYASDTLLKLVEYDTSGAMVMDDDIVAGTLKRFAAGKLTSLWTKDGLLTTYYENGKIKSKQKSTNNKTVGQAFDENGKEINFVDSFAEGNEYKEKLPEPSYDLITFLGRNMIYPDDARESGKQGKILVRFDVDIDGSIINVLLYRGVTPLLDEEALRIISIMPAWKPGLRNGKPVKASFTEPIWFKLE